MTTSIESSTNLWIHVGYPKTGTTFIQRGVLRSLSNKGMINVLSREPEIKALGEKGAGAEEAVAAKRLLERFDDGKTNVISRESLIGGMFDPSSDLAAMAENLAKAFPGAEILVTIRGQYSLLKSLYTQYVYRGGHESFRKFIGFENGDFKPKTTRSGKPRANIAALDFHARAAKYAELFGKKNVTIIPYESLSRDYKKFLTRFAEWLEVDPSDAAVENARHNPGCGKTRLRVARFANRFLKSKLNPNAKLPDIRIPFSKIRTNAFWNRKFIQSRLAAGLLGDRSWDDPEVEKATARRFAASNAKLDEALGLALRKDYPNEYFLG